MGEDPKAVLEMGVAMAKYGDAVVGFCVLQAIGFVFLLGKKDDPLRTAILEAGQVVVSLTKIATVIYAVAVAVCAFGEWQLRDSAGQTTGLGWVWIVGVGRIVICMLANGLVIWAIQKQPDWGKRLVGAPAT